MKYQWRKLTGNERDELLKFRKEQKRPWHSSPHPYGGEGEFHITAACYEHISHVGFSDDRMDSFADSLLTVLCGDQVQAWCVLPNHYHLYLRTRSLKRVFKFLGRLHGRTSFLWNKEENKRGRQVWHSASDRA